MYPSFLKKLLQDHPLTGIEIETVPLSPDAGLTAPDWIHEGPVYEIFVRNFSDTGSLNGVREKLSYLKTFGVKTLWLMPLHPVGLQKRKGTCGSPYAVRDYNAIAASLGNTDNFSNLVREIHGHDMRVIIDLVINHAARDHVWRITHPEYFLADGDKRQRKLSDWTDVMDLNFDHPGLRKELIRMMTYWVREFGIDGYRCDVAGFVPVDFWQEASATLQKINPDLFMLAEWENSGLHRAGFHATYDWSGHYVLMDIYKGKRSAADALTWLKTKREFYPRNSLFLRFTENHDFPRTREKFGRDHFYPFAAFPFLIDGIPMLYNGQEWGAVEMVSLFEKESLDWSGVNQSIFDFYRRLITLRKNYPVLRSADFQVVKNNFPERVVSFVKRDARDTLVVVLNFSAQTLPLKIELPGSEAVFEDLLRPGKQVMSSEFNLPAYGVVLLEPAIKVKVKGKLERPDDRSVSPLEKGD